MLERIRHTFYLGGHLFLRDFNNIYRRTIVGPAWSVVGVVMMAVPFIIVGEQFGFGGGKTQVPYRLFALVGVVLWSMFWQSVVFPQAVARRYRHMLREVVFPPMAIVVSAVLFILFQLVQFLWLSVIAFSLFKIGFPLSAWGGLLAIPAIIVAGLSIGIFLVPPIFVYMDGRYLLPFLSTTLIWSAPIFYVTPEKGLLRVLNKYNPLTYLIGIPRSWLTHGTSGNDLWFFVALLPFLLLFLMGIQFYKRAIQISKEQI